jgi:PKD repeat protein
MRRVNVVLIGLIIGLAGLLVPSSATSASYGPGSVVKDVPVNGTPHVLDGRVNSVVQVGNTIVLGGQFTQTRNNSDTTVIPRNNLVAFDATTKQISTTFAPNTNGTVNVVLPTGDGETVFVGGSFTSIGGQARKNLAKVRVSDGAVITQFNAGDVAGQVKDLRLAGGRLWVAGGFTHIAGKAQKALATLNPTTGSFNTFMRAAVAGIHNSGYTTVMKIDVNVQGTRLVAIGNFDTVNAVKNHQIFQLDLAGTAAALTTFRTNFYETRCSTSFDTYLRDLDFSPDGSFFVVSTTGAYGGAGVACDSTARFETSSGAGTRPSWINNTGGDTTYAVEITDSVVYTGGHARWQNNPFRADSPGQGAVPRAGIAALDPINGLPLSWNPTRDRGVGVFDFLVTDQGLWVASDTTRIGASYLRSRIALLPLGGTQWPGVKTPTLPSDLYSVKTGTGGIARRAYDGTTMGANQAVPNGGMTTDRVRGSFMLNGSLYTAWSDGTFDRRTFDGTTYGAPVPVDTASKLTALTDWTSDIQSMTGLFYDSGRLYFTKSNSSSLFYRYFTPENDVVGAQRLTASTGVTGVNFSQVRGMFSTGTHLYWATSSGELRRLGWEQGSQSGVPATGASTLMSGPAKDGINWSSMRSLFLFQDAGGEGPPQTPVADFTSECTSLTCTFDSGASSVEGATISSQSWTFGTTGTSTDATPEYTFPAAGTYPVKLTVTSSKGLSSSVTKQVQVTRTNRSPVADFTTSCNQLSCTFTATGSSDPDGTIASYAWDFGDNASGAGNPVQHPYATAGTRNVTLTVTDNEGATATKTAAVVTTVAGVGFVDAASTNSNGRTSHTVKLPAGVQAGDTMVLFLTTNSTTSTMGAGPAGWTEVQSGSVDGLRSAVWTKKAVSSDLGATVAVSTSATAKSAMTVAAYRPTSGSTLTVAASAKAFNAAGSTALTTPQVPVNAPGSWLVSYWGAKASTPVTFSSPASQPVRSDSVAAGTSGNISARLADSGGPAATGTSGGFTAGIGGSASRAAMYSIVITPQAGP